MYYSLFPFIIPYFHLLCPISIYYSLFPSIIPYFQLAGEGCSGLHRGEEG